MNGELIGVFGSNAALKTDFLSSIGKKSETEGIIVFQRNEAGKKFSFLDDSVFPEKIQGYARIASIVDHAFYIFPTDGKLTPSDGELAIMLDSFGLKGEIQVIDGSKDAVSEMAKTSFKGLNLGTYPVGERSLKSSVIDLSHIKSRTDIPKDRTLIYIDRAFSVKGVGVVLGFILNGRVSLHDRLRILPDDSNRFAEVKGIQISDEDYDTTERGIRVGLSLKGVELKDLSKISWMDDGSFRLSSTIEFSFKQSPYYKQQSYDRDLHLEVCGESLVSRIVQGQSIDMRIANLQAPIPIWEGMTASVIDLNSKSLRVVGGGIVHA